MCEAKEMGGGSPRAPDAQARPRSFTSSRAGVAVDPRPAPCPRVLGEPLDIGRVWWYHRAPASLEYNGSVA